MKFIEKVINFIRGRTVYVPCPDCKGEKEVCIRCKGKGVILTGKLTDEEKKIF